MPKSVSTLRVRYAETDKMGVVYYANYFVWFEVGRTDLLRGAGWTYRELEQDGVSLPVIQAQCDYRLPARYDDELLVRTSLQDATRVRLTFDYEVVRKVDGRLLASGRTVHAFTDPSGRPRRLTRELLPWIVGARGAPTAPTAQG